MKIYKDCCGSGIFPILIEYNVKCKMEKLSNDIAQYLFQYISDYHRGVDFQVQRFLFNGPFHQYNKHHLSMAFFENQTVMTNLRKWMNKTSGVIIPDMGTVQIPCSITNMSFFDRLKNPKNNVVDHSGNLRHRIHKQIDKILIADNLRAMILDKDCAEFSLYSKYEREEFIFHIFTILVIGGEYCQYEENLESYLELTKVIYKDLVCIGEHMDNNTFISTIVLQIVGEMDTVGISNGPDEAQNIGFLLIDGNLRKVTSLLHRFSEKMSE